VFAPSNSSILFNTMADDNTRDEEVKMASIGNPEVGDVQEEGDVEEEGTIIPLEEDKELGDVKGGDVEEDNADEERGVEEAGSPVQEQGADSRPVHSFLYYIVLVGALFAAVVALSVALAVVVSTDDDTTVRDEQQAGEGGDRVFLDKLVEGNGLAQVPMALVDFLADVVALPAEGTDKKKRRLAIPPDMLKKLNGKCATLDQYTAAENTQYWQCSQKKTSPNFPLELNADIGKAYKPADNVLELLANATGASLSSLQSMRIGSGQPSATNGSWCGMPAPGAGDLDNVDELLPQDALAHKYWTQCVSPRAGYFNVLQCEGDCDEGKTGPDCSTYAVLGYAAMDASVCYPCMMVKGGVWFVVCGEERG
jgi:hypothetical protein